MTRFNTDPAAFWSWETELADVILSPFQFQASPRCSQDTELLQQLAFVPGLKELLMLRQVHALEHATVWVLSDRTQAPTSHLPPQDSLGGMSTDQGFYLYGRVDLQDLTDAAQVALKRITSGDWDLAVHPRCGTNLSVGLMVMSGLALGSTLLLPRNPLMQLIGFGAAASLASQIAPNLGSLAQKYLTTAVPFNLVIDRVFETSDQFGNAARFVQVHWIE
jgi:hypothetical protein